MNKFIKKLAAVASCLAMVLVAGISLTACGKNEEKKDPPPPAGTITFVDENTFASEITEPFAKLQSTLVDQENIAGTPTYHEFTGTDTFFGTGDDAYTADDYYVKYATLAGFDTISTVKIGTQEFGTDDVNISLGNNHFIKAKAWRIVDGKLEVSVVVLYYEMVAGKATVTINGVTATPQYEEMTEMPTVEQAAFLGASAAFDNGTSQSTVAVTDENPNDKVLDVTITLKDGKQAVALKVGEKGQISNVIKAMVKVVKNGKVSYALSSLNELGEDVVLGVFPVTWKDDVSDVQTEYAADLNTTVEVSAFVNGALYNARIKVTAEAAA